MLIVDKEGILIRYNVKMEKSMTP
ncbi:MAG: hypothetical protein PWQ63_1060, partial [Methanolobus sp.]|nr:hypothetical protein [Methanolobus sp.]